jgi:hypothetical protein
MSRLACSKFSQIIVIRAKNVETSSVAGFQIAFFLIAISGGWRVPKVNLATRLSEVLLVEERMATHGTGGGGALALNSEMALFWAIWVLH